MTRVIADQSLKAQLKDFAESLEIHDATGKVVGYFEPAPVPIHDREIYDWAKAEFAKDEAELEKARQDPISYTTQEVLEYLRSL